MPYVVWSPPGSFSVTVTVVWTVCLIVETEVSAATAAREPEEVVDAAETELALTAAMPTELALDAELETDAELDWDAEPELDEALLELPALLPAVRTVTVAVEAVADVAAVPAGTDTTGTVTIVACPPVTNVCVLANCVAAPEKTTTEAD